MVQEPLQWKYTYISMGVTLQDFSPPSVVRKRFFAADFAACGSKVSSKSRCEPPIATRTDWWHAHVEHWKQQKQIRVAGGGEEPGTLQKDINAWKVDRIYCLG